MTLDREANYYKDHVPVMNENMFYAGHVTQIFSISRRTLQRWIKRGWIESRKTMNGRRLFTLTEINRVLRDQGKEELTPESARRFWEAY
jgi:hypothetical protein